MTKILEALDAITSRVLAYRPDEKGLAAKNTAKKIDRKKASNAKKDQESST